MSGRKAITDAHGNYLFTVRKRLFRLRSTFYGETKDGKELFELKRSMTSEWEASPCAASMSRTCLSKGDPSL